MIEGVGDGGRGMEETERKRGGNPGPAAPELRRGPGAAR